MNYIIKSDEEQFRSQYLPTSKCGRTIYGLYMRDGNVHSVLASVYGNEGVGVFDPVILQPVQQYRPFNAGEIEILFKVAPTFKVTHRQHGTAYDVTRNDGPLFKQYPFKLTRVLCVTETNSPDYMLEYYLTSDGSRFGVPV